MAQGDIVEALEWKLAGDNMELRKTSLYPTPAGRPALELSANLPGDRAGVLLCTKSVENAQVCYIITKKNVFASAGLPDSA